MSEARSLVARAASRTGILALLLVVIGAGGAMLGVLPPMTGFTLFGLGVLPLAALTLLLGVIGLLRTGSASGRTGRRDALLGTALGVALLAVFLVSAGPGRGLPRINDITTSPDDPPAFVHAARELGEPLAYDPTFAPQQRAGYPDLTSLRVDEPPAAALERVRQAAAAIGLEVVDSDAATGRLEAREVTRVFRFVDDVVVRVRPAGAGSVVDVRSRSRDGQGDLGANAARIRRLAEALG